MNPALHALGFPGVLLARGFWLYVWHIVTAEGETVLYMGMTGDTSSPNSQSPFSRVSQHLGTNKHATALRRHLEGKGIEPTTCRSLDLVAYEPILPEAETLDEHKRRWRKIGPLERALGDALKNAGYGVLNDIHWTHELDEQLWQQVRSAFASRFDLLKSAQVRSASGRTAK